MRKFFVSCFLVFVFVCDAWAGVPTWRALVLISDQAYFAPSDRESWSDETVKTSRFGDEEMADVSVEVKETFHLIENLSSIKNGKQIAVKFDLDVREIDHVLVMVDGDYPGGAVSVAEKDKFFSDTYDLAVVVFKDQPESDLDWSGHAYVGLNIYNHVPTAFCAADTDEPLMPYLRCVLMHELAHLLRENWLVKGFWLPPVHDCYHYDGELEQLTFFYDWFAGCIKNGKKDVGIQPKMWKCRPSRQLETLRKIDANDSHERPRDSYPEDREYEVRCFKIVNNL